jgi:hypothetical protein
MVAMFAGAVSTIAFCPVGTFPRLQLPVVFQSVLVLPVQRLSWALVAERAHDTAIDADSMSNRDGPR